LTLIEQRLTENNLKLLKKVVIEGAHAGDIYRIDVLDDHDQKSSMIYKEFAGNRNNEIDIHSKLSSYIKPFSKVIAMWESSPEAILMCDLKSPLKADFTLLSDKGKRSRIESILERLAVLHSPRYEGINSGLPTHHITSEWLDWCTEQLNRLCSQFRWARSSWVKTIESTYEQLDVMHYIHQCPNVITHGDPHLENIFYQDGHIWFIDWEWTAMGSPLRDITILCQDIYDTNLIQFISKSYQQMFNKHNLTIHSREYQQDFNYFYIDHSTMMLAWEIEKYFQGYTSVEELLEMIEFKISEIKRTAHEENSLSQS
jgi:thiamine kinase-like enzyme